METFKYTVLARVTKGLCIFEVDFQLYLSTQRFNRGAFALPTPCTGNRLQLNRMGSGRIWEHDLPYFGQDGMLTFSLLT